MYINKELAIPLGHVTILLVTRSDQLIHRDEDSLVLLEKFQGRLPLTLSRLIQHSPVD
jgi:hypothetical protein